METSCILPQTREFIIVKKNKQTESQQSQASK